MIFCCRECKQPLLTIGLKELMDKKTGHSWYMRGELLYVECPDCKVKTAFNQKEITKK